MSNVEGRRLVASALDTPHLGRVNSCNSCLSPRRAFAHGAVLLGLLLNGAAPVGAGTVLSPWTPVFKGVDYAVGTNTPGAGAMPDLQVVYTMRIDLTDPDIRFYASPRTAKGTLQDEYNYVAGTYVTAGYKTSNFLRNHGLQVAINANNFHDPGTPDTESPDYGEAQGTPFVVDGVLISQGVTVNVQNEGKEVATFLFTTNNQVTFIPTNWPAQSTAGAYTAVTGLYTILANGVNVGYDYVSDQGTFPHGVNPRTAFGLSKDRHYLYLMTIDGRQAGYSDGDLDWEAAAWLLLAGAWDGANMDGGGSTCLVMEDSTGAPKELNHDSSTAGYGYQRTVGAHFGVYAKPLPGFFNDINVLPDDTAATISFTTIDPATTQLEYGLTTNFTLLTIPNTLMVTNHAVLLTNLTPATEYFFAAISKIGANQYVSSNYTFFTTNYVTTNVLCDFPDVWSFTIADLDGTAWTTPGYDDSAWEGSGPGLFWADTYGFYNPDIPEPVKTAMPLNPDYGIPFSTYYFRTHFTSTNPPGNFPLLFEDYLADGAVFYLNGAELYRLRMPTGPILNATPATAHPCDGDATCPDDFIITNPLATNLVSGDNVLAVEVHTMAIAHAATFGMSLVITNPFTASPPLTLAASNATATLSWNRGGFMLQQANSPLGPWTTVPGPVITSPFATAMTNAARFYRLAK